MERAILAPAGAGGTRSAGHRAEVLSVQGLAFRVLESMGGTPCRALTEPARTMVLRHLLAQQSNELRFYRRACGGADMAKYRTARDRMKNYGHRVRG